MPVSSAPNAAQSVRQERRSIAAISAAGNLPTRRTRRNSALSAAIHSMRTIGHEAFLSGPWIQGVLQLPQNQLVKADGVAVIQVEDRRRFPFAGKTAPSARSDRIQSSMTNVPVTMRTRPHPERRVSFSRKTTRENATVTRMLSLSMGTTTLAGPSCKAR